MGVKIWPSEILMKGIIQMVVWVATHYWDDEVNEGSEVLGVFKNHDRAYKEIEKTADIERKNESDDFWAGDYTWAEGDEIHLGHPSMNFSDCNVEHIFKVTLHNVNEEI